MAVVSDLEGTLTTGATWRALGQEAGRRIGRTRYLGFVAGRLPALGRAWSGRLPKRHFQDEWLRRLTTCFAGVDVATFEIMAERAVDAELWPRRREDVIAALRVHLAAGERVVVASGALQPVVEAFARRLGRATGSPVESLGTPLEVEEGRLTGRLIGPVSTGEIKARRVHELLGAERLSAAYGDSAADVPLLLLSDAPVAVYPDDVLRATAQQLGWRVLVA
jgi:HAD superfamily hydrolase (TIGR01490 family)